MPPEGGKKKRLKTKTVRTCMMKIYTGEARSTYCDMIFLQTVLIETPEVVFTAEKGSGKGTAF